MPAKTRRGKKLSYPRVLRMVRESVWAITPDKIHIILDVLARYAVGDRLTEEEILEQVGDIDQPTPYYISIAETVRKGYLLSGDVDAGLPRNIDMGDFKNQDAEESFFSEGVIAVLPIFGTIAHRANMFSRSSGGTSTEELTNHFRDALANDEVKAIVFDVDSNGGTVNGVDELSREIAAARGTKPIISVANDYALSAAYWLASAADKVYVTPSGEVGSVGVYTVHEDMSKALETAGRKYTFISRGRYKTEANPYEPLTEEAKAALQEKVDESYDAFVSAVAYNRNVTSEKVTKEFGEGRTVSAQKALQAGMVDDIATFDKVVLQLAQSLSSANTPGAAVPPAADVSSQASAITEEVEVDWKNLTIEELQAQRPDMVEGILAQSAATVETLQARITELEGALDPQPLQEAQEQVAALSFQLALAEAAHVGWVKDFYQSLQAEVSTPEELAEKAPALRLKALNEFLKKSVDTGKPTGTAHPRLGVQEGDDKPDMPEAKQGRDYALTEDWQKDVEYLV